MQFKHIDESKWQPFLRQIFFVRKMLFASLCLNGLIELSPWIHVQGLETPYYTPRNEVRRAYWIHPVCLSVCPSVCPLTFRVRPVASTVQDGFFPYFIQMINSMRGCVACDDPWPWHISSRSFDLDLENCVHSVAYAVLDGFFFIFGTNDYYY